MSNVLLLRAPSQDVPDKYEIAFQDRGYHPFSIPVLETGAVNVAELQTYISNGPGKEGIGAVVITSARAVEVWKEAIDALAQDNIGTADADWTSLPFYVVGEATATALADLSREHRDSRYIPHNILGGAESGTAEKLAHYILKHHPLHEDPHPTFLYLTGDKNRDTLPSILTTGGITLRPLQVYETKGLSTFAHDLDAVLLEHSSQSRNNWWIVYFAPSSADFVTPVLGDRFILPYLAEDGIQLQGARIAAIGPTTSTFLTDTLKLRVDAIPSKPSPEALVNAVYSVDHLK
ncbi:hypothetical protein QCA50_016068 [Cerrena zonata]|uniref:Tetrapyrrole biosynthesis uroporphyrinogen III synthase domain-containing protein n=1 Tax=Cerrena zonata TaxID=2478898 RepID=A0AAW0FGT8_9APHY